MPVVRVVSKRGSVARTLRHRRARRVVEPVRPVEAGLLLGPIEGAKVVDDVPAPEDEDSSLAKRREPGAKLEVEVEVLARVDRELHHGNVRFRKRMHQHRPRAAIEAPAVVVDPYARQLCDLGDLLREARIAWRRLLDLEELLREAEEVVDRPRAGHRGDGPHADVPACGDDEDRARSRNAGPEGTPRRRISVRLERVHRAAVSEERGGHSLRRRRHARHRVSRSR